jgi:adenosine deaminase
VHGFSDAGLAALARSSLAASRAPLDIRAAAERDIASWLG